jgi:hypothetical protein
MLKIALVFMNLLSSPSFAAESLEHCGSLADRKLKAVFQAVEFPDKFIQLGQVGEIERIEFVNLASGTANPEFFASYKLTYKLSPEAHFEQQVVGVRFTSSFGCESLKVRCLEVESNVLAPGKADPNLLLKLGPLSCKAQ